MSKTKVRAKWAADSIEPELNENYSQSELIGVLNWYNNTLDTKTVVKYLNTYLKSIKSNKVLTPNVGQQTAAAVARLISRGLGDDKLKDWMDTWVARLDDKVVVPVTTKKVVTIQERTAIKLNEYITGLDNAFENFIDSEYKMKFNTEKYLADASVKASYIQEIIVWASGVRNEYVLSKTVPIMKEGYSTYTTPQKNKVIKFFDVMIDSLEKYKVAVTPTRKKKIVPASKVVSKVKYAKVFPELKLKSVDPEKLIGAKEVWLYNTATKMLHYYTSDSGMTVSGTSLRDFDSTEQRRLRKPKEQLAIISKARKGQWIKKFQDMAKTVISSGTGRLNDHTIILKSI
jgi:hypothetical protein